MSTMQEVVPSGEGRLWSFVHWTWAPHVSLAWSDGKWLVFGGRCLCEQCGRPGRLISAEQAQEALAIWNQTDASFVRAHIDEYIAGRKSVDPTCPSIPEARRILSQITPPDGFITIDKGQIAHRVCVERFNITVACGRSFPDCHDARCAISEDYRREAR